MKLILDEGLPLSAAALLRESGIDSQHVLELSMGGASDEAILDRARNDGAIIVTLDSDFHQILALTHSESPSVIRIRIENLSAQKTSDLLNYLVQESSVLLNEGALISVTTGRIRIRKLPIR